MRPLLDHTITVEEISRLIGVKVDLDPSMIFSGATSSDSDHLVVPDLASFASMLIDAQI